MTASATTGRTTRRRTKRGRTTTGRTGAGRAARWLALAVLLLVTAPGSAGTVRQLVHDGPHAVLTQAGVVFAVGRALDVYRPDPPPPAGGLPVVVMVPSCCGDRSDLGPLAEATAAAGALVLVADWTGPDAGAPWGRGYGEVVCAVRYAQARAPSLGGDPRRVALLGWSDGALPASATALVGSPQGVTADRCTEPGPSGVPRAVVGVAGFYGWTLPVPASYDTARAEAWLGGAPSEAPDAWRSATPYAALDRAGPTCWVLLVGATDPLAADAQRFAAALQAHGHRVLTVLARPAGDQTMLSPRTQEGRTTVTETLRATTC